MNTIHIFAYGEAQIIGKDLNYKTDVSKFTKLQAVIDDVKSKKPADVVAKDYHAINIFNDMRVSYLSKEKDANFHFKFSEIDSVKLNALIQEFADLKAQ
jgi:hypothetical protein